MSAIKQPIPVLLSAIKETLLLGSATLFVDFLIGLMLLLKGSWSHCVAEAGGGPAAFAGSVKNGPVVDQNVCNRARCCSTAEKGRIEVDTKGLIQMRALMVFEHFGVLKAARLYCSCKTDRQGARANESRAGLNSFECVHRSALF